MDDITVLITGSGAPGIKGTLYSLQNNFDNRNIITIGTDIRGEVVGKYLCDSFYQISHPLSDKYIQDLLTICENHGVDVILPQNTAELVVLSSHRRDFENIGTKIAISDKNSMETANDKYKLLKIAETLDIPIPRYVLVDNSDDLKKYASEFGWPETPVVVKPPISNGMRGLRIIDESINLKEMFYSEKPTTIYTTMKDILNILEDSFPPLIIMEYLSGKEYTVDVLRTDDTITIIPRSRDLIRSGITFEGTVEREEDIIRYCETISMFLDLKYAHGYQFKCDGDGIPRLLECNPRIQGTMVLSTLAGANIIYGAVKYAMGEDVPPFDIKWGTRFLRFWGGIGVFDNLLIDII